MVGCGAKRAVTPVTLVTPSTLSRNVLLMNKGRLLENNRGL